METPAEFAHIAGWGVDLDRADRPAYPRERKPNRLQGVHWHEPEQQTDSVEVLRSNERPAMTPLFGTTVPPTGLSGSLRRIAFRYSENDLRHWLLLLGADRINMVEGLFSDLARGHVPNVFAEVGGPAELRHNRAGAAKKTLVVVGVLAVGYLLLRPGRRGVRTAPDSSVARVRRRLVR